MINALVKLSYTSANYIAGFLVNILMCVFMLVRSFQYQADQTLLSLLAVVLGLTYYGFLEYAIHRWIFHGNWLSEQNPMKIGHASHHEFLQKPIAQPFFFRVIIGLAHWAPLSIFLPQYFVSYFLFGLFTGYLYYGLLHHVMHSGYKYRSRYFRRLAAFHVLHHKHPANNFGIIGRMWDRVFDSNFRMISGSPI